MKACRYALAAAAARPINCWDWALVAPGLQWGVRCARPAWPTHLNRLCTSQLGGAAERKRRQDALQQHHRQRAQILPLQHVSSRHAEGNDLAGRIKSVQAGL